MDGCKEGDELRLIVPPGTEEVARQEGLTRARKIMEDAQRQGPVMEEVTEGGRQGRWRGLRRGNGGQMRFVMEDGEGRGDGEEGQAQEAEGREPGREEDAEVGWVGRGNGGGVGEGEGAATERDCRSGSGEEEERQDSGRGGGDSRARDGREQQREGEEQEEPVGMKRGSDNGRPKRKRARGVRYGEESSDEPG